MRDQITAKGNRERRDTATLRTRINESNTTDACLLSRGGGGGVVVSSKSRHTLQMMCL